MSDPLNEPAPDDVVSRIHAFARDLAYGASVGWWASDMKWQWHGRPTLIKLAAFPRLVERLDDKWQGKYPDVSLMFSLGYLAAPDAQRELASEFVSLTDRAFMLLAKPIDEPSVFISYRRSESSTFALLLEARLKLVNNPNSFVDKNIPAGEEWAAHIEDKIKESAYFVLLVGPTTLGSEVVQMELNWAMDAGCQIISLWHNGAHIDDTTPDDLRTRHAIFVQEESALGYETAVAQLLNSMGYTTY